VTAAFKELDCLIVGSGGAAVATAMALDRAGRRFSVLDVGFDLDGQRESDARALASRSREAWDPETVERLFPAPQTSAEGVERRLAFGSDHPYRIPPQLALALDSCALEMSHALGGFGNVWGAAVLPYHAHSLRDWPISPAELARSYENVARYMPISAEHDALSEVFPIYGDRVTSLERTPQTAAMLKALDRRASSLRSRGVAFGRARVAVDSSGGGNSCRRCGYCLDGCVYGAIFNPKALWGRLETRHQVHRGEYVLDFSESDERVTVRTIGVADGEVRHWRARRVFIGAGQLGTTRILARSLELFDRRIRIADSQYFFFPLLSFKGSAPSREFTLAEIFVEILNRAISEELIHYQVYGFNRIFEQALRDQLPRFFPLSLLSRRFYLLQGYLHSRDSGHLELTVRSEQHGDRISIKGIENPAALGTARRSQALLRRELARFGLIPPLFLKMVPPGRSFHTGSSFPMGASDRVFSSDSLGRPAGLRRVHIVDAACFPSIAGSTILVTIMANADRIARETVEGLEVE
jgi:choline dehydrogenase-like flavoprotein